VIDNARKLRSTYLDNTSNVRMTLNVFLKFLIMLEIYSRSIESTNMTLELRYRHKDLRSPKSLIEFLESYLKLLINIILLFNNKKQKRSTYLNNYNLSTINIMQYIFNSSFNTLQNIRKRKRKREIKQKIALLFVRRNL